jgi:hypothetical protein
MAVSARSWGGLKAWISGLLSAEPCLCREPQFFILQPGDVIITGTPPGFGAGIMPEPKFLKVVDVVWLGIDGSAHSRKKNREVQGVAACVSARPPLHRHPEVAIVWHGK